MDPQSSDPVGRALARIVAAKPGAEVVDIGGGSGTRAVPLAQAGCRVLVVDASTDALASLARRAAEAGVSERITALQADADQIAAAVPTASADLVLYHQVVQNVDDPVRSLAAATSVLRPGGHLSVLVPGRLSAALGEALAGRFAAALDVLAARPDDDRRYDVPSLRDLLEQAGAVVETIRGVGVIGALVGTRARPGEDPDLVELERQFGRHPVLGQIAGELHALGLRPSR